MLLQILEDGYATDAKGRKVDFRNTIIIMTSNVGAESLYKEAVLGFQATSAADHQRLDVVHEDIKAKVLGDLRKSFRPELLNRIDNTIVFRGLDHDSIKKILDLQLAELGRRLAEQGLSLKLRPSARVLLLEKGYDINRGARPMRRAIQDLIEDPLALAILEQHLPAGTIMTADVLDGGIKIKASLPDIVTTTVEPVK